MWSLTQLSHHLVYKRELRIVSKTECNQYLKKMGLRYLIAILFDLFNLSSEAVLEHKGEIKFCTVGNGYEINYLYIHEHAVTRNTGLVVIRSKERMATENKQQNKSTKPDIESPEQKQRSCAPVIV